MDSVPSKNLFQMYLDTKVEGVKNANEGRFTEAIRCFERAYNFNPNDPDNLINLCYIFNKLDDQKKYLNIAIQLIRLYEQTGDKKKAFFNARSLWLQFPNHPILRELIENHLSKDIVPECIGIEITTRCNLNCPGCERLRVFNRRAGGSMKLDQFEKLIRDIEGKVQQVILHNNGESMLHPDIIPMLRIASEAGLKPSIDTNGSLKMDHEEIVKARPEQITFALDGFDQETYEQYRINGNLDLVKENIRELIQARKRLHSRYPQIIGKLILMKCNEKHVDQFPAFAQELGCDGYQVTQFTADLVNSVEYEQMFAPSTPGMFRSLARVLQEREYLKPEVTSCFGIYNVTGVVRWNGDVVPCCRDTDSDIVFGNAFEPGGFLQVWNSARAKQFRIQATLNSQKINLCRECFWAYLPPHLEQKLYWGKKFATRKYFFNTQTETTEDMSC